MQKPLVSIVTPVYNGEQYIREAIESVLAQTYQNFELLIINDGSTDGSAKSIHPFLQDPRITYREQHNAGVAAARNQALGIAKGKYLAFLDQDDLWLPEKLEKQVNYLTENPDYSLVHSWQLYVNSNAQPITNYPKDWVRNIQGDCFNELFAENKIGILTTLVKKDCIEAVGGFNESISRADDYELWLKLAYSYRFGFINEALVKYRLHTDNESRNYLNMEIAQLGALNSIINKFPEIKNKLGKKVINKRLLDLYIEIAKSYRWQEKVSDTVTAHKYYKLALKLKPYDFYLIKNYCWTALSQKQRQNISWYKKKISDLI